MQIRKRVWLSALPLVASLGGEVQAQCAPNPVTEWFPDPLGSGDEFGLEVTISGNRAVVGAALDDDLAPDAGAIYVYERTPSGWVWQAKLYAPDAAAEDHFGIDVSIDGDVLVAGARQHDHGSPSNNNKGAAYVFAWNGSTWIPCVELQGSGTGVNAPLFGSKVSLSGDTIVIGSYYDDDTGTPPHPDCGAVYVYVEPTGGWCMAASPLLETAKLIASDRTMGDGLGFDVVVDGPIVVTSALWDDHSTGVSYVGSVYVFEEPPGEWMGGAATPTLQVSKIVPAIPVSQGDEF